MVSYFREALLPLLLSEKFNVFLAVTVSGDNQDTQMAFAIMKGRRILQNLCVHSEPS